MPWKREIYPLKKWNQRALSHIKPVSAIDRRKLEIFKTFISEDKSSKKKNRN